MISDEQHPQDKDSTIERLVAGVVVATILAGSMYQCSRRTESLCLDPEYGFVHCGKLEDRRSLQYLNAGDHGYGP